MNKKCHRTKSFLSGTPPYRCNSYVSQVSQKDKFSFCNCNTCVDMVIIKLGSPSWRDSLVCLDILAWLDSPAWIDWFIMKDSLTWLDTPAQLDSLTWPDTPAQLDSLAWLESPSMSRYSSMARQSSMAKKPIIRALTKTNFAAMKLFKTKKENEFQQTKRGLR